MFKKKEQTLVVIKPDAVRRGLISTILAPMENKFELVNLVKTELSKAIAEAIYQEHEGKDFYPNLIKFMTTGESVIVILEGIDAVNETRWIIEKIRGTYQTGTTENCVHASDTKSAAKREVKIFTTKRRKSEN